MGSLVAYMATQSKMFPLERLANIVTLAAPLEESPQLFNGGVEAYIEKITSTFKDHLWNEVVHVNFYGGPRD